MCCDPSVAQLIARPSPSLMKRGVDRGVERGVVFAVFFPSLPARSFPPFFFDFFFRLSPRVERVLDRIHFASKAGEKGLRCTSLSKFICFSRSICTNCVRSNSSERRFAIPKTSHAVTSFTTGHTAAVHVFKGGEREREKSVGMRGTQLEKERERREKEEREKRERKREREGE